MDVIRSYRLELNHNRQPVLVEENSTMYGESFFDSPKKIVDMVNIITRVHRMAEEYVWMIALDTSGKSLGLFRCGHGTVNQACCSPREIMIRCLAVGAVGFVVIHNHPSGDPRPSKEDRTCAERLQRAGKLLGVTMQDFIIIGKECYYSFCDKGDLQ